MFDAMDKEIDAVLIATPDHWHAALALRAMKMGKHVYCEKPLAHSIYEVRALMQAARRVRRSRPNWAIRDIRSTPSAIFREWIEDGAIGSVREVHAMCRSMYSRVDLLEEVKRGQPVPETLDWDLWVGPAQFRPYHSAYHPGKWRGWTNFGTGVIGDWTCHVVDPVFWTLDLGAPTTIEALEPEELRPRQARGNLPGRQCDPLRFPGQGQPRGRDPHLV